MANRRRRGKYYPHLPGMVLTMGRHRPFPLVVLVAVCPHWHPVHVHIPLLLGSSATWHSWAWGMHGPTKHITIIEYMYVKQWKQLCILVFLWNFNFSDHRTAYPTAVSMWSLAYMYAITLNFALINFAYHIPLCSPIDYYTYVPNWLCLLPNVLFYTLNNYCKQFLFIYDIHHACPMSYIAQSQRSHC